MDDGDEVSTEYSESGSDFGESGESEEGSGTEEEESGEDWDELEAKAAKAYQKKRLDHGGSGSEDEEPRPKKSKGFSKR